METAQTSAPQTNPVPPPEDRTKNFVFEVLYKNTLKATGSFADGLRRAGYDLRNPQTDYSNQVFAECLEVAAKHVFPRLEPATAFRQLGRTFVEGYFKTMVGKVLAMSLPVLGPHRMLFRASLTSSNTSSGIEFSLRREGGENTNHYVITCRTCYVGHPEFTVGAYEEVLARTQVNATVTLQQVHGHGYELDIQW